MITKWIVPISGFTQSQARTNGIDNLWLKIRGAANGVVSVLPPQKWNSRWKDVARWIWAMSHKDLRPEIYVFSYSWGAGHGHQRLAKCLQDYDYEIDVSVMSDPVFHSWLRPWRALCSGSWSPPLWVTPNVREVWWFRQTQNHPQGTDVFAVDPKRTTVHDPVTLVSTHQGMDDSMIFHAKCMEVLGLIGGTKREPAD